jgi:hypothetical protein
MQFIGKLDIFPLMCAADKVWLTELTLIHKNIRSVRICKFGAELHFNCLFIINTPFVVPVVHCSFVTLNIIGIPLSVLETFAEVQTSPTYLLGGISYPNDLD